jgi:dTDP-4-amino-4,6-dideoxygalactose transaminase
VLGQSKLDWFIAPQYRLNEFSGGVLLAQARKLDTIVEAVRSNARRVYAGIRDLPGVHLRLLPDPEGELGSAVFLGFPTKDQCERYIARMKEENVPANRPTGSAILPVFPHIEKKTTVHPAWPSFNTPRGRSIQYGAACCPRTIDVLARFAGVSLHPKFTKQDTDDIVAAIRRSIQRSADLPSTIQDHRTVPENCSVIDCLRSILRDSKRLPKRLLLLQKTNPTEVRKYEDAR